MKTFKISQTLINRDAVLSTLWSTLQQIVVAGSTYFIIEAIRFATKGDYNKGYFYIGAFAVSLIIVYLPNTISMLYLQRWRLSSIQQFVHAFIDYNVGQTSFGCSHNKKRMESWLTNEVFTVYEKATHILYQIYSTFMNSFLNILVIAMAIDTRIVGWYAVAGTILMISNFSFQRHIRKASTLMQESRKDLSNVMLSSWENIFIGNQYNFEIWKSSFAKNMASAKRSALKYDIIRSIISSVTVSVALAIVAIGNAIFILENRGNIAAISGLFITLPRQLQIIQSIFSFFNLTLDWSGTYAQLKELESIIHISKYSDDSSKWVQIQSISCTNGQHVSSHNDIKSVLSLLKQSSIGRWTLRGPNGVGKSTLLSLLKEWVGKSAYLLPSKYTDLSFQEDIAGHSDGNKLLSVFSEISRLDDVKYVFLDEWDANLDGINLANVNAAIDELAKTKFIMEVRHRV